MKKFKHTNLIIFFVVLNASLSFSYAAKVLILQETNFKTLQKQFFLQLRQQPMIDLDIPHVLKELQKHTDDNQINHYRMQQYYRGYLVFGGYGILHSPYPLSIDLQSQQVTMNGKFYDELAKDLGAPPLFLEKNRKLALTQFKKRYPGKNILEQMITPLIYVDGSQRAFWAYKVILLLDNKDNIPEKPTAIVNAKTLQIFIEWDDIKTLRVKSQGIGYGGNLRTSKYTYGNNFPYLHILRDADTRQCWLENTGTKVVDMKHCYTQTNEAMRFDCLAADKRHEAAFWTGYRQDGYDMENGAFSPSNDALFIGYIINRMYQDWYGVSPLTKHSKPMQLVMRVHYGKGFENAFWDGKQMTFGDGGEKLYPLVSIGVGAHEITHGFTEQHSNLIYHGQPGAINEAFSDMADQTAEFYINGNNRWIIGSDLLKETSGLQALRYMNQPSLDGVSIDRATDYYVGMNIHRASGVYNRLFYLLANQTGWNTRRAFAVMLKANMDYWTPHTNFEEGGCGLLNAAKDLNYSQIGIKLSLHDVNIDISRCRSLSFR